MIRRLLVVIACMCAVALSAQAPPQGEISGRVLDMAGGAIPGVRVSVPMGGATREVVTDANGNFKFGGLPPGSYELTAALAGFISRRATVALPYTALRAYIELKLEIGCLVDPLRVQLSARSAAPMVDTIVHLRVRAANDFVQWATAPDCSSTWRDVGVELIPSRQQARMFVQPSNVDRPIGSEYIALLWETSKGSNTWYTMGELVLPVTDGKVVAPWDKDVHDRSTADVLALLHQWSRKRPAANPAVRPVAQAHEKLWPPMGPKASRISPQK